MPLRLAACLLTLAVVATAPNAPAQDYPNKPVRIITAGLGGGSDLTARVVAPALASRLGQQVIVENRPSGVIPGETVANAPPDGYTLLLTGSSFFIGPLLQKTPYDPVRDFAPVTLIASEPSVLVVHPSLPVKSVKDLIALAKGRPGDLNYSATGTGSAPHLAMELFKSMAGANIVRVPYTSTSASMTALTSGEVQLSFGSAGSANPYIKAVRVKALAVTSANPSALLPALPTVASTVPGYELISVNAMFAPGKTPGPVVNRVNQDMVRALNQPDVKEKLFNMVQESVGSSPAALADFIKADMARQGKVIKDLAIRTE